MGKNSIQTEKLRYPFFDSVRGVALILMAVYHFSFDLNEHHVIQQNMNYDDFWLNFRALIMTLFLGLVGVSFSFTRLQYSDSGFQKRLLKIAACAFIISIGTYIMNPQTWIYFGVLHFIFVVSLVGPWLVRLKSWAWLPGVAVVILPLYYRDLFFNQTLLGLTGLSPLKPNTEDFSPFFPWLGVVLIGISLGAEIKKRKPHFAQNWELIWLSWLGRHSLVFYMTHQLVLYPLAYLISLQ